MINATISSSSVNSVKSKVELFKGSTLVESCTCADVLQEFTVSRDGSNNQFFGFGVCHKLTAELIDIDNALKLDTVDSAKIGFSEGGVSFINPYPNFYSIKFTRDEQENVITITGFDLLDKAIELHVSDLNLSTYTVNQFADACAVLIGAKGVKWIGLNASETIRDRLYSTGANFNGTETIRAALNAIAEITQTIYYLDNADYLVFKRLDKGAAVLDITKDDYFELTVGEARTLGKLVHATELGDNLETGSGAGDAQYIRNNPFWDLLESTEVAGYLDAAFANVGGTSIQQIYCDWNGNYLLEVGDRIALTKEDGSQVYSYLLKDTVVFDGTFNEVTEWKYGEHQGETAANPTNLGEALNKTYAMVDKIEKEIKLYVGEVVNESVNELVGDAVAENMGDIKQDITDVQLQLTQTNAKVTELTLTTEAIDLEVSNIKTTQEALSGNLVSSEERIANLEIGADGLNSSVSTLQKNIEETNGQIEAQTAQLRTEIQQSSESVQIEIQNIKEEGATKVVTKTGYTFDDEGLTVSKSGSGVSTQITNNGMTVNDGNSELLTANGAGVSAKDLHARTYLIIGGNSRFEDYNGNRTACFWVGG